MEMICNKCGYKVDVGKTVEIEHAVDTHMFICTECNSTDVRLVDIGGGLNITVDGINEDTLVHIAKELTKNFTVADVISFFSKKKKE